MSSGDDVPIQVNQVPLARRPALRQWIESQLPDDMLRQQWQSIFDSLAAGQLPAHGLLEVRGASAEIILGAIWLQPQDGRVANVLAPVVDRALATILADRVAHVLLEDAVCIAKSGGVRLVQALLETDSNITSHLTAKRFQRAGFIQLAELLYLVSSPDAFPTAAPAEHLQFEPWAAAMSARFEAIIERTYVGTCDCPQLNGVRLTSEVLASYRSVGQFDPQRWLIVRHAGQDIGCLLITEHPQKIWELVYMGLVPEARGHGYGLDITRHGQWLARQAGANRFALAVDATNAPAIRSYAAAGLKTWDRRAAWLRILDPAPRALPDTRAD
jgi:GNAT superfamily N-acetyltransferase